MAKKKISGIGHCMTPESVNAFLRYETDKGASENMLRRFRGALGVLRDFLPEDKVLTRERLLDWRKDMEHKGYAEITILNYVKYINRYLDFAGCSELRFNRGRAKDLTDVEFGYLEAVEPTGRNHRGEILWLCRCRCGNTTEVPASSLLGLNTLSCGCITKQHIARTQKYIDRTSVRASLDDRVASTRSASGYVGVTKKRGKWHAYLTYKGVHYSLGSYTRLEDAVAARARKKEEIMADARILEAVYDELHKGIEDLPNRHNVPKKTLPQLPPKDMTPKGTAVRRVDNTSGHTGIHKHKNKWTGRVSHKGYRYNIGTFEDIEDAVKARDAVIKALEDNEEAFIAEYLKTKKRYPIRKQTEER